MWTGNEEQLIKVSKPINANNAYEDFKVVTDTNQVQQVKEIINNTHFENIKVDMARAADYQFHFQYKNPNIEAKAVLFQLWISPNLEQVEIVSGETEYARLSKENSIILLEVLTK